MGFLKSLDICNFKSYKGKHSFGPFDATKILSILGQNGEGKSNFTDAIAFVFGDKSGSLRARHLRDLCFCGIAKGGKIPSECYVSATYCVDRDQMVVFKREIVSEGRSCHFRIDDVIVTQKEYIARLCDLGIDGVVQNFIIQQGAVDKMGIMNSMQRTAYFERISKSIEFKQEYEDLSKKRDEKHSEQSEVSKRHAVARKVHLKYKAEMRSRDQYEKEKANVELLSRNLCLMELYELHLQLEKCDKSMEELREEETLCKSQMSALVVERTASQNFHEPIQKRVEENIQEKSKVRVALDSRVTTFACENNLRQLRLDQLRQKINSFEQKKTKLVESRNVLESQIRTLEAEKAELSVLEKNFTYTQDQIANYDRIRSVMTSNSTGAEIQQLETERAFMGQTVERSSNGIAALKSNMEAFQKRMGEMEQRKQEKTSFANTVGSELNKAETMKSENQSQLKANEQRKEHLDTLGVLYHNDDCHRASETDCALYRRQKETIVKLKSKFGSKRVLGRFYELLKPSDLLHSRAIDAALGNHTNWIIVSSRQMVRECSAFLDEQHMPPEIFVPLNKFKISSQKSLYASDERSYHTLGAFFDLSERFYALFSHITDGIAVCDSAEEAQSLIHSEVELEKAVSLDGHMFCKFSVSTFSKSLKSPALIEWMKGSAEEELLPSRNEWETKLANVNEEIKKCSEDDLRLSTLVDDLTLKQFHLTMEIDDMTNAQMTLNTYIASLRKQMDVAEQNREVLVRECAERDQLIHSLRTQQMSSSSDLYADLCKEMGITQIDIFESARKQLDDLKSQLGKRQTDIQKLQSDIQFLQVDLKDGSFDLGTTRDDCQHLESEISRFSEIINTDRQKLTRLDNCLSDFKEELDHILRESSAWHSENQKELFRRRQSIEKSLAGVIKRSKETNRLKQRLLQQRNNLMKSAKDKDGIVLPFVNDVSFKNLPKAYSQATDEAERHTMLTEAKRSLKLSVSKLKKTKVPGSDCRQELDAAESVVQSLNKQLKAIKSEIRKLDDEFINVRDRRKARFEEFFNRVNDNVLTLYRVVTADESAYAQLTLDDVNEPFAGGVQYACILPSKTATMFEMMSSGEQTLAALALSLAIHATLNTPLLILDEVDAALDMHNTDRLFSFLRSTVRKNVQVAVISHRYEFLYRAEHVVGLYMTNIDEETEGVRRSTHALSFDATAFEDADVRAVGSETSQRQQNADWSQISFSHENSVIPSA